VVRALASAKSASHSESTQTSLDELKRTLTTI
jgi:hypothetical protein